MGDGAHLITIPMIRLLDKAVIAVLAHADEAVGQRFGDGVLDCAAAFRLLASEVAVGFFAAGPAGNLVAGGVLALEKGVRVAFGPGWWIVSGDLIVSRAVEGGAAWDDEGSRGTLIIALWAGLKMWTLACLGIRFFCFECLAQAVLLLYAFQPFHRRCVHADL